jgi:dynein heavy chain
MWPDPSAAQQNLTQVLPLSVVQHFNIELNRLGAVERAIEVISPIHIIGALSLNTNNIKLQLRNECRAWKVQYSNRIHQEAKSMLFQLNDYITSITHKLQEKVDGLDSLSQVMKVLRELRAQESFVEMKFAPIFDLYQVTNCSSQPPSPVVCVFALCCTPQAVRVCARV